MVDYVYNNIIHTSFEIIEGRSKLPLVVKYLGIVFVVDKDSSNLKKSFQRVKDDISISQRK